MITKNALYYCLVFIVVQLSQPTNSARILGFFSTPSVSHLIIHESLMRELASRGHEVSMFFMIKLVLSKYSFTFEYEREL